MSDSTNIWWDNRRYKTDSPSKKIEFPLSWNTNLFVRLSESSSFDSSRPSCSGRHLICPTHTHGV